MHTPRRKMQVQGNGATPSGIACLRELRHVVGQIGRVALGNDLADQRIGHTMRQRRLAHDIQHGLPLLRAHGDGDLGGWFDHAAM